MSDLPKWPSVKDYTFEPMWIDASGAKHIEEPYLDNALYQDARAEAAIARLKVAVEAFQRIADTQHGQGSSAIQRRNAAEEALTKIGPLPEGM